MSVTRRQGVRDFMEEGIRDLGARGARGEMSRDGNDFFGIAALACSHSGVIESKTPSLAGQPVLLHQDMGFLPYGLPAGHLLERFVSYRLLVGNPVFVFLLIAQHSTFLGMQCIVRVGSRQVT